MNMRQILSECAIELAEERRFEIDEVVSLAQSRYPDFWRNHVDQMAWNEARLVVRNYLREATDEPAAAQMQLPGIGLPAVICVRGNEDRASYYVGTPMATWQELRSGELQREANVEATVAKLRQYRASLQILAPVMESDPEITVQEAWEQIRSAQQVV